jgi:hypothetical protein
VTCTAAGWWLNWGGLLWRVCMFMPFCRRACGVSEDGQSKGCTAQKGDCSQDCISTSVLPVHDAAPVAVCCRSLLHHCHLLHCSCCSYVPDTVDMNTQVQQRKVSSCC